MLVQHRPDALRLVTQHDHALISGELARAWRGPAGDERLPLAVILASALHDMSWRDLDRFPLYDAEAGLPHDFTNFPRELRRTTTAKGLREVERIDPYAGTLVALHYRRLGVETPPAPTPVAPPGWTLDDPRVQRDSGFLRLFDNLSLFACLTPPGSGPGGHYPWLLDPKRFQVPGLSRVAGKEPTRTDRAGTDQARTGQSPTGDDGSGVRREDGGDFRGVAPAWRDPETLALTPFPFGIHPLDIEVPCRELPRADMRSAEAMEEAWRAASLQRVPLRIVDGLS